MSPGGRRGAIAIAGLAICLGLAANASVAGPRSASGAHPGHPTTASLDLTGGARDATFSARGMMPGDSVTAAITIANPGRESMSYTMSRGPVSADGALLSETLILTIKTIGSSCADNDGTTLYDGPLDEAAFGGAGDGLPLAAATAQILCFRAVLPLDAGNALQGAAASVTLTFGATQQTASK